MTVLSDVNCRKSRGVYMKNIEKFWECMRREDFKCMVEATGWSRERDNEQMQGNK